MFKLLKRVREKYQHGLLLHAILRKLAQLGLRISPFYLVQEGVDEIKKPEINGNPEEYAFDFSDITDFEGWEELIEEMKAKKEIFLKRLEEGKKCIRVKHKNKIVAYTWYDLEECRFTKPLFKLSKEEAYLFDMYTLNSYRGRNIAPCLRYQSYEILNSMGRTTLFSISELLNVSAVKFKRKLNARFLSLYLNIGLFKKKSWNLKIKEYRI